MRSDFRSNYHSEKPQVSVIIPAFNAQHELGQCLDALEKSTIVDYEVIIANDSSNDSTSDIARNRCDRLVEIVPNQGPSVARNTAARLARAPILFFLDADVLVFPRTLELVLEVMKGKSSPAAMFCSYQPETPVNNFVSKFKNFQHHYTHQISNHAAHTFCGGFGAIRKRIFQEVGEFDPNRRAMEDVELGFRLCESGHSIELHPEIQLTHLKLYNLRSLVKSDVFMRAIPWMHLILSRQQLTMDLNLKPKNLLSAFLTVSLWLILFLSIFFPMLLLVSILPISIVVYLNREFLSLASTRFGNFFAVRSVAMLFLFFTYSTLAAFWATFDYRFLWTQSKKT